MDVVINTYIRLDTINIITNKLLKKLYVLYLCLLVPYEQYY